MKKTLLVIIAIIGFGFAANAQSAIGLRGAFGSRSGLEVSYQTPAWGQRLEVDVGWNCHKHNNNIYVAGVYQWDWNIVRSLDWYAGFGAAIGVRTYDDGASFGLGILGQIGIEWTFRIPLKVSVDLRPQIDFIGDGHFGMAGAVGVRYVF